MKYFLVISSLLFSHTLFALQDLGTAKLVSEAYPFNFQKCMETLRRGRNEGFIYHYLCEFPSDVAVGKGMAVKFNLPTKSIEVDDIFITSTLLEDGTIEVHLSTRCNNLNEVKYRLTQHQAPIEKQLTLSLLGLAQAL